MVGHREKPAAQVVPIDAVQVFQGTNQRLLQVILGLVMVPQDAEQEQEQRHRVASQDGIERSFIAGAKARDQSRVCFIAHAEALTTKYDARRAKVIGSNSRTLLR